MPDGATLHPINLVQLVAPYLPVDRVFGGNAHELSLYVGAVPLMLALWVLVRRSDLGPMKRLAQATAAFAAAALLLALGSQGQFVRLQNSIPWAAWFQFSCRYTVLFQFAVAVLAAIGFVLVEREAREKQKIQRHLPLLDGQSRAAALWRQFEILGATVLVSLAVAVAGLDPAIGPPGGLAAAGPRGALAHGRRRAAGDRRRARRPRRAGRPDPLHGRRPGLLRTELHAGRAQPPTRRPVGPDRGPAGPVRCRRPRRPAGLRPARLWPPTKPRRSAIR